jgi:uncharacterized protein (DUF4415 family)
LSGQGIPEEISMSKPTSRFRATGDSRQAAEAAFKKATTKPAEPTPKQPSIPGAKEMVSLRIDRDVLDFFQEDGPGWQDRINEALRKAAGK